MPAWIPLPLRTRSGSPASGRKRKLPLLRRPDLIERLGLVVVHPCPHDPAAAQGVELEDPLLALDAAALAAPIVARVRQDVVPKIGQLVDVDPVVHPGS